MNHLRSQSWIRSGLVTLSAFFVLLWLSATTAYAQNGDLTAVTANDTGDLATLGVPYTWTTVVGNQGSGDLILASSNRLLLDELPDGTYGEPAVETAGVGNDSALICTIGGASTAPALECFASSGAVTLGAGAAVTVTLPVTPTASGPMVNPAAGGRCAADPDDTIVEASEENNDCSDSVTVGAPDLTVEKSNDTLDDTVTYGETFLWTVTLRNVGDRAARFSSQAWMLDDELPASARYSQPTVVGATGIIGSYGCVVYNKYLSCQTQSNVVLEAGTGALTVQFAVTPLQPGTLTNDTAVCKGDPLNMVAESNEENNGCTDSLLVSGVDLQLTKRADQSRVAPGATLRYTLAYTNAGNDIATGVAVTETVPAGTTFNAGASSADWDCADGSVAGVQCHAAIGTLAVDGAGSLLFAVDTLDLFTTALSAIANTAHIGDDGRHGIDFLTADNRADANTPIEGAVALTATQAAEIISGSSGGSSAMPGDKIRYTVSITNTGTVPAEDVLFSAMLDPNVAVAVGTVQSSHGTIVSGNLAGQTSVEIDLDAVAPMQPVAIRFDVIVADPLAAGVTAIVNQSTVSGANFAALNTDDPATSAPGDPTVTPVKATPLLSATLDDALLIDADGNERPSPGDRLRYTVAVRNDGNGAAADFRYEDTGSIYTELIPGTVNIGGNGGTVLSGNGAGDKIVRIELASLAGGGAEVAIQYDVAIATPLPAGVTHVQRQGVVTSEQQPQFLTSDPDGGGDATPTMTALDVNPRLRATMRDQLLIDLDESNSPSPGDTLLYQIRIRNDGNAGAAEVRFEDPLDVNLTIVPSGVQTSVGAIVSGLDPADRSLIVNIGELGAGEEVEIALTARISHGIPVDVTILLNQGIVKSANQGDIPTDDPDQPGTGDPTRTLIASEVVMYGALQDYLLVDADDSGTLTKGDTLLYRLDVYNYGNLPARNGLIEVAGHSSLLLQSGSVRTDLGRITAGNSGQDSEIAVVIDVLPPGEQATITFQMTVGVVADLLAVEQQAVLWFDNPRGGIFTVFSDDPATSSIGDRTISELYGLRGIVRLFLPFILR